MHVLISNDDGYLAPGIDALNRHVSTVARTTVVAPRQNCSGASNSLTLRQPIYTETDDRGFVVVDGTPADCVHLAVTGMLTDVPDMVISGINAGANMGDDIMYSGTVAAAIEGRFLGLPAIAVSLASWNLEHFQTAGKVIVDLLQRLEDAPLPEDSILNVNVPDIHYESLAGWCATRAGARHQSQPIIRDRDSDGDTIYRIGPVGEEADSGPGTDFYAIANNCVSVTPVQIDMTRHDRLHTVGVWLDSIHHKQNQYRQ
ncbi:MAG: 5'/3'-nucleotidase SurE [Pseudomonadota bacterium]